LGRLGLADRSARPAGPLQTYSPPNRKVATAATTWLRPEVQDIFGAAELARYKVVDLAALATRIALAGFVGISVRP
jgi:hypothetical protein